MKVSPGYFYTLIPNNDLGHDREIVQIIGSVDSETLEGMMGYVFYDHKGRFYWEGDNGPECKGNQLGGLVASYDADLTSQVLSIVRNLKNLGHIRPEVLANESAPWESDNPNYFSSDHPEFKIQSGSTYYNRMGFKVRLGKKTSTNYFSDAATFSTDDRVYNEAGRVVHPTLLTHPSNSLVPSMYDLFAQKIETAPSIADLAPRGSVGDTGLNCPDGEKLKEVRNFLITTTLSEESVEKILTAIADGVEERNRRFKAESSIRERTETVVPSDESPAENVDSLEKIFNTVVDRYRTKIAEKSSSFSADVATILKSFMK